jgi:flagellar biosynthesis anti-sigma factor FlgM
MQIQLFGATSLEIGGNPDTITASTGSGAAQTQAAAAPQDSATISSAGSSVSELTAQALQIASVMESRVLALREAVTGGQYQIAPTQIADAILSAGL